MEYDDLIQPVEKLRSEGPLKLLGDYSLHSLVFLHLGIGGCSKSEHILLLERCGSGIGGHYYYSVNNADSQIIDSFGLFNISGNYQLTDNLTMSARLNNITNKEYVTALGYNTDGTNFFTSLTYNWF